jgi:hypothetical protein
MRLHGTTADELNDGLALFERLAASEAEVSLLPFLETAKQPAEVICISGGSTPNLVLMHKHPLALQACHPGQLRYPNLQ